MSHKKHRARFRAFRDRQIAWLESRRVWFIATINRVYAPVYLAPPPRPVWMDYINTIEGCFDETELAVEQHDTEIEIAEREKEAQP